MTAPAKPPCGHWNGPQQTYCGSTLSVRRYIIGHRCPDHTPAAIAGKPEPEPGPGWPIYRTGEQV